MRISTLQNFLGVVSEISAEVGKMYAQRDDHSAPSYSWSTYGDGDPVYGGVVRETVAIAPKLSKKPGNR